MICLPIHTKQALASASSALFKSARTPKLRTRRQFAEAEIRLPTGPHEGKRFRCHRQPFAGHLLDAMDSGQWNEFVTTGPSQSGKSLCAFVLPILYHLFERNETVLCGLPDIDMAGDKWREDILPVIHRTRYRHFLPTSGSGSRGGMVEAIKFRHGPTLKFMGGGGNDKTRAAFTSRVLIITETDGLDTVGGGSREADKIKQLEARTRSFGSRRVIYKECTVSTEEGHTWQQYQLGTSSRLVLPCPHCHAYVLPERENFHGHEEAEDMESAQSESCFFCPACGEAWTEAERIAANQQAQLLHTGQEITNQVAGQPGEPPQPGQIVGVAKPTSILGFRWSAVHNLFTSMADLGADEWKSRRAKNHHNADREMRQFVWCLPIESEIEELSPLDPQAIPHRILKQAGRQFVPASVRQFCVGVDFNSKRVDWVAVGFLDGHRPHIVDYGEVPIERSQGLEAGVHAALLTLYARLERGFVWEDHPKPRVPDQIWTDSSWFTHVAYPTIAAAQQQCGSQLPRYYPIKGYGAGQERNLTYRKPTKQTSTVVRIGEEYHFALQADGVTMLVELDANHWKSHLRSRLECPLDQLEGGPLTLFDDLPSNHFEIAQHFTAEEPQQEYVPGKGLVTKWVRIRKANHKLDAAYIALAAGHFMGARLPVLPANPTVRLGADAPDEVLQSPSGQSFSVLNR